MAQRKDDDASDAQKERLDRFIDDEVFAFSIESEDGQILDPETGEVISEQQNEARLRREGKKFAREAERQRDEEGEPNP